MRILVCIKQILDPLRQLQINQDSSWVTISHENAYKINHYDEFAMEESLQIKELYPETLIDVLSAGPSRVQTALRRGLELGLDQAFHIHISEEQSYAPKIAFLISEFAQKHSYDLILLGVMAEDDMQGQVGPMLSELLGMPCATSVISQKIHPLKSHISIEREIENGQRLSMDIQLPAVLTIQSGSRRLRYPSLSNMLKAKKQLIYVIEASKDMNNVPDVFFEHPAEEVFLSAKTKTCQILEGNIQEKARQLYQCLQKHSLF